MKQKPIKDTNYYLGKAIRNIKICFVCLGLSLIMDLIMLTYRFHILWSNKH